MNAVRSFDEDVRFLPEEPASAGRVGIRGRVARWAGVGVVVGVGAVMMAVLVVHAVRESLRASRRQQCAAHLDRLGLAMQQYHAEHGHFPAPALAGRDGTPLLSWR